MKQFYNFTYIPSTESLGFSDIAQLDTPQEWALSEPYQGLTLKILQLLASH